MKIGDKVKVISMYNGHNYILGNIYHIHNINGMYFNLIDKETGWIGNNISESELELIIDNIESLEKELLKLETTKQKNEDIIEFLKINGDKEYDDKNFLSYTILKISKQDNISEDDKMKKIKILLDD